MIMKKPLGKQNMLVHKTNVISEIVIFKIP